jgi:hypothetical protein
MVSIVTRTYILTKCHHRLTCPQAEVREAAAQVKRLEDVLKRVQETHPELVPKGTALSLSRRHHTRAPSTTLTQLSDLSLSFRPASHVPSTPSVRFLSPQEGPSDPAPRTPSDRYESE